MMSLSICDNLEKNCLVAKMLLPIPPIREPNAKLSPFGKEPSEHDDPLVDRPALLMFNTL
jgi:hypothetical protein